MGYVDRGLLALKYRNVMASAFGTANDPVKTESALQSCSALSRLFFTRRTGLPSLINPAEGLFALNAGDLQSVHETEDKKDKKDKKNDKKKKKGKKGKKDKKKKGKKSKKDKKK